MVGIMGDKKRKEGYHGKTDDKGGFTDRGKRKL